MYKNNKKQQISFVFLVLITVSMFCGSVFGDPEVKISTQPSPRHNAWDIDPYPTLSWKSGPLAGGHDVYFGTDKDLVEARDNSVFIYTFDTNSYTPGMLTLATRYYWAVDEVNDTDTWAGDVWKFRVRNNPTEGYAADLMFHGGAGLSATRPEHVPCIDEGIVDYSIEVLYDGKETEHVFRSMHPNDEYTGVSISDLIDDNALFLYPDREPRYRMMMVFGGDTTNAASAAGEEGQANVQSFYRHGGSYQGSCAGAWLAQQKHFNTCPFPMSGAITGGGRICYKIPDGKTMLRRLWNGGTPNDPSNWYYEDWQVAPRSPVADMYPEYFADGRCFGPRMAGGPKITPWGQGDTYDPETQEMIFLHDVTMALDGEPDKSTFFNTEPLWRTI